MLECFTIQGTEDYSKYVLKMLIIIQEIFGVSWYTVFNCTDHSSQNRPDIFSLFYIVLTKTKTCNIQRKNRTNCGLESIFYKSILYHHVVFCKIYIVKFLIHFFQYDVGPHFDWFHIVLRHIRKYSTRVETPQLRNCRTVALRS